MSLKEADRYAVIWQVLERTMKQGDAAAWLGLSVRQVKRLVQAVREQGAQGVISKRRGVASNRRIDLGVREHYLEIVRQHYPDYGPLLAAEHLREHHGFAHSNETLRAWMMQAQMWRAKSVKARSVHSPRERRSRVGELVQIDGSPHAWLEERAPKCCLIAFIDDATSTLMHARFYPVESTGAYLDSLQRYVGQHGRPVALYSDRHSIFTKHDPEDPTPTQFERALGQLNIESILAYTPQAKGRVERVFQTLQDRLVKALRQAGLNSIEQANAWLDVYIQRHNARFAKKAIYPQDAHRPFEGSCEELARICAHHHERTLSKALTCQFKGRLLVVLTEQDKPRYALRRQPVSLVEYADGELQMWHGQESIPFKVFERHEHLSVPKIADDKMLNARVDNAVAKQARRIAKLAAQLKASNGRVAPLHGTAVG